MKKRMDEAIAPTNALKQNAVAGFFKKMDESVGNHASSPEEKSKGIVARIVLFLHRAASRTARE